MQQKKAGSFEELIIAAVKKNRLGLFNRRFSVTAILGNKNKT